MGMSVQKFFRECCLKSKRKMFAVFCEYRINHVDGVTATQKVAASLLREERFVKENLAVLKVLFLFPTAVGWLNIINPGRCWKARQIGIAVKIDIPSPDSF